MIKALFSIVFFAGMTNPQPAGIAATGPAHRQSGGWQLGENRPGFDSHPKRSAAVTCPELVEGQP
jgi:hypothetical protein